MFVQGVPFFRGQQVLEIGNYFQVLPGVDPVLLIDVQQWDLVKQLLEIVIALDF